MHIEYQNIPVNQIEFDSNNPRIKKALEQYGNDITAQRIYFALKSADDKENAASSFSRLSDSIRAFGGITQPITVYGKNGKYTCIDGNTRLAIYKEFGNKKEVAGDWDSIIALVLDNPTQKEIDSVRISAHLVGARPWPAYEKARYLHHLYYDEFKDFDEMVALCGGNKNDIQRQIHAYEEMDEYYRDKVDDTAFHIDRFSGFVELQKPNIKNSIFDAGFDLNDFGEWIKDGKIHPLNTIRQLPAVLSDSEAKKIFTEGGIGSIKTAIKHVERNRDNSQNVILQNATLEQLIIATKNKFSNLTWIESKEFNKTADLEDLYDMLRKFLSDVRK